MSRELKLALILGFAAVMVVGVLVSDHMSGARQARIEERTIEPPRMALQPAPPVFVPEPVAPPAQGAMAMLPEPDLRSSDSLADAGPTMTSDPVVITMAPETTSSPATTLASNATDSVREFLEWTAKQGMAFEPVTPLAETTVRPRGAPSVAASPIPDRPVSQPAPTAGRDVVHVVAKNETLWGIAQRYYGDGSLHPRIVDANKGRLGRNNSLFVGAKLTIPGATRVAEPPASPTRTAAAPARTPTPQPASPTRAASTNADRVHVVQKGETLGAIAARELGSARRWPEIVKLNKIDDPDNVPAGVRLRLPPR